MIANIERETKWSNATEYGPEVLEIIEKHYLPATIDLTTSQATQLQFAERDQVATLETSKLGQQPAKRQPMTCSLCGMKGHTSKYSVRICEQLTNSVRATPILPGLVYSQRN